MGNEITRSSEGTFSLDNPKNLAQAKEIASMLGSSGMVPNCYKGKPNDILICCDYGRSLGFNALQSLQSIAVINGTPSIYGDGMIALIRNHPDFAGMHEEVTNNVARCTVKRAGKHGIEECVVEFSKEDAVTANLWGKSGPWKSYPKRMLKMRARGFALRDLFADALKGMKMAEEMEDYEIKPSRASANNDVKDKLSSIIKPSSNRKPADVVGDIEDIEDGELVEEEGTSIDSFVEPEKSPEFMEDVKILHKIVVDQKISGEIIQTWMEKGNASSLSELKHDTIKALIKKYSK